MSAHNIAFAQSPPGIGRKRPSLLGQPLGDRASAVPFGCRKCFPFCVEEKKMKSNTIEIGNLPRVNLSATYINDQHEIAEVLETVAHDLRPHFLPRKIGPIDPLTCSVFLPGLEGGARTMRSIAVVLECGWPAQAIVLARTLYEMSVRLLWASRESDGAARLFRAQVVDRREGRAKLSKAPDTLDDERGELASSIAEYTSMIDSLEKMGIVKGIPKLPDLITRINELDVAIEGVRKGAAMSATRDYAMAFATASEVAHGNPTHFSSEVAHEYANFAHTLAWRSSIGLVRASHYAAKLDFPAAAISALATIGARPLKTSKL